MCTEYRVFNLSGKRSCGPGQCRPATAGSTQGVITIYEAIFYYSFFFIIFYFFIYLFFLNKFKKNY